jgi:hypothetical protein
MHKLLAPAVAVVAILGGNYANATNTPANCETLQNELLSLSAAGGGVYQFAPRYAVICSIRGQVYMGAASDHALLVPEDVTLDLNDGHIDLRLQAQGYGIRLARRSTLKNGHVGVVYSDGAGSQGIFHSAVTVGAANHEGGTVANPSYFSNIGNWKILNLTIEQPFPRAAIAVMSEAHHGEIDHVRIVRSAAALIGISLDWGDVGNIVSADAQIPAMRVLFDNHQVYTTHPHDITITNIEAEPILGISPGTGGEDNAVIRTSAVHNITIRGVIADEAQNGIVMRAGDLGYEFALGTVDEVKAIAHAGLVVEDFTLYNVHDKGVYLDGQADNVSRVEHDPLVPAELRYHPRLGQGSSEYPGFQTPWVRYGYARGHFTAIAGVYLQFVKNALIEDIDSQEFGHGIRVDTGVRSSTIWRSDFLHNVWGVYVGAGDPAHQTPPDDIVIADNRIYSNSNRGIRVLNGTNIIESGNQLDP